MTNETEKTELLPCPFGKDHNIKIVLNSFGKFVRIICHDCQLEFHGSVSKWNTRTPDLSKLKSDEAVERVARAMFSDTFGFDSFTQEKMRSILDEQAKAALAEVERILKDD